MPNFSGDPDHTRVTAAAIIIVESGAVYSLCLIILIILYMTQTWTFAIVQDAMPQVIVSDFILYDGI